MSDKNKDSTKSPQVWIEQTLLGDCRVMLKFPIEGLEAFCHVTYHYNAPFTDNATVKSNAVKHAISLGATEPVEIRAVGVSLCNRIGKR